MNCTLYIVLSLLFTCLVTSSGQEVEAGTTRVASQLAVGHLNLLDTYLSNEKYRGTDIRFVSEVVRDSGRHPMTYMLTHEGAMSALHTRSENLKALAGHYDFAYSMMRRWQFATHYAPVVVRVGGFGETFLGFCYKTTGNANNPAQGYAAVNVGPHVMAETVLPILGRKVRVTWQARIPLFGLTFSPNYGQSYYEMFNEGNYDRNVVFTSIATFQMRQQISFDIPVWRHASLRIGYLGDIRQQTPNNLRQHQWYNAVLLGVTITKRE